MKLRKAKALLPPEYNPVGLLLASIHTVTVTVNGAEVLPSKIFQPGCSPTMEFRPRPECFSEAENGAGRNDFSDTEMFHVEH
jgi:hypothetical protein